MLADNLIDVDVTICASDLNNQSIDRQRAEAWWWHLIVSSEQYKTIINSSVTTFMFIVYKAQYSRHGVPSLSVIGVHIGLDSNFKVQ